jgi:hypothetical protein
MRELTVRSMLHGAALGDEGDAVAATLLAADIDNPVLTALLTTYWSTVPPDIPRFSGARVFDSG